MAHSFTPLRGISWSPRQARELGIDPQEGLERCLELPIQLVRLGAYWDELQSTPDNFDPTPLRELLELCEAKSVQVILTIGVKAPRWPEFYFPAWVGQDLQNHNTQEALLEFVKKMVKATRNLSCLAYWQVENEPLDPSGPQQKTIPLDLLEKECHLVRTLDDRPILLTAWGNDFLVRNNLPHLEKFADIIGIDIYYRQHLVSFLGKDIYRGPAESEEALRERIAQSSRPVWIAELQAEPWEKNRENYLGTKPASFSLSRLQENWQRAVRLQPQAVLFWGAEYWLWQEQRGNTEYLQFIREIAEEKDNRSMI